MTQRCHGIHCICHVDLFKGIGSICMQDATHLLCWSWLKHYVDSEHERLGGWGKRVGLHVRTKIFVSSQWAMKFDVQKNIDFVLKKTRGSNTNIFCRNRNGTQQNASVFVRKMQSNFQKKHYFFLADTLSYRSKCLCFCTENAIRFSKNGVFPAGTPRYTAKCLRFCTENAIRCSKSNVFLAETLSCKSKCLWFIRKMQSDFQKTLFFLQKWYCANQTAFVFVRKM